MKLSQILKPSRMFAAQIACLSILIGIGAVVSPFIIRSVVDGFLISQDRAALIFSIFIVATFEAVSFGADFLIRNKLNELVKLSQVQLKAQVFEALLKKRVQPDLEFFNRTWSVDIKRVVNHDMRQRWLRYKDIFLVTVMSFVMMNLSSQAGFFILAIGVLQFSMAAWDSKRNRDDVYSIRQSEELEYQNLKTFLHQLPELYDKDLVHHEVKKMRIFVEHSVEKQSLADRNRSFLWDLKVVSRGLLIMGALTIAAFGGVDMSWAAGTFWALMMVIFRLANPLSSVAQWIFSERAIESSRQRVADLLNCFSDETVQSSSSFQQFKNMIGKNFLQKSKENSVDKIQIIFNSAELEKFKDIARQWSSRFLWGSVQVLTSPLETPNKKCSHCIYVIDNEHLSEINLSRMLSAAPHVCVLTSVPLPESFFVKNFLWLVQSEKFLELTTHQSQFLPELTEIVREQSNEWKEAFRDLKMYCKLKVPFELMLIKWDQLVTKSAVTNIVRDVDHVIMGPNGLAIILLIGSEGLGSQRVIERMNQAMAIKCQMLSHEFINANRDTWQKTLALVEQNLTTAMYSSKYLENKEVA